MNVPVLLTAIQSRLAEGAPVGRLDDATARRQWWAALDTLQYDILLEGEPRNGLWLAAPLPALYEPELLSRLHGWVWSPQKMSLALHASKGLLLPGQSSIRTGFTQLPLRAEDGQDPLLMIITPNLQVALALQGPSNQRRLLVRSDPETIGDLLTLIDRRLEHENHVLASELRQKLRGLGPLDSSSDLGERLWPRLAERLAGMAPSMILSVLPPRLTREVSPDPAPELNLLEALTHEIRTPLATIRTLIRSLLRRHDLPEVVTGRLQQIDAECTEQIDRFGLIFHAAELERTPDGRAPLACTDLRTMIECLEPGWRQLLERRGLELVTQISPGLPPVLSDPGRLESMLGGLIDRSSRSLLKGGRLLLLLSPAGHRLKLQILVQEPSETCRNSRASEPTAELGPVLSWNPSTGSLQLSQGATQRLLASLGGRLTSQRDPGLTVFFPVAEQ